MVDVSKAFRLHLLHDLAWKDGETGFHSERFWKLDLDSLSMIVVDSLENIGATPKRFHPPL